MKVILIVLDSVGVGYAPDAASYDDLGAATLPNIAKVTGGLRLPVLESLGLGNIPPLLDGSPAIQGVAPARSPLASYGAMIEKSQGKDTITGHWEIIGMELNPGFHLFPPAAPSFPGDITCEFIRMTGRDILGNKAASGTEIIEEFGEQHMRDGKWIVYTSADSVFQIAAHESIVPLDELYRACQIARELCNPYRVGRVIARPFTGEPGQFKRTENRRDFAFQPAEQTLLERITAAGHPVYAVGKIEDIVAHRGITESNHTGNTMDSQQAVEMFMKKAGTGLIFANFIDFDMIYGHRRDPDGYAKALIQTDEWIGSFLPRLAPEDILLITADHGNDPTHKGTDHTREAVPLLVYGQQQPGRNLGVRQGYFDIAQSIASMFRLPPLPRGRSFYP